jgi:hypothetical protein
MALGTHVKKTNGGRCTRAKDTRPNPRIISADRKEQQNDWRVGQLASRFERGALTSKNLVELDNLVAVFGIGFNPARYLLKKYNASLSVAA